jgi:hypothetical protein
MAIAASDHEVVRVDNIGGRDEVDERPAKLTMVGVVVAFDRAA